MECFRMKKILMLGVLGFGLVGCVGGTGDMLNNNYTNIQANDSSLKGLWSGNNGPYLVTFKFNGDGTGVMCSSWGTADMLEKLKISDNILYMQSGLKQKILEQNTDSLTLKVDYFGGTTYKYKPDNNLKNASPYCEKEFK